MGYISYISGNQKLVFSRPLSAREAREAIESTSYLSCFFRLDVIEEAVETDEGTLTKISAPGLITIGEGGKARNVESELRDFIASLPGDISVSGYIERIGEQWPDAERWYVEGRTVTSVRPEIAWRSPIDGKCETVKEYDA